MCGYKYETLDKHIIIFLPVLFVCFSCLNKSSWLSDKSEISLHIFLPTLLLQNIL